jgi:hypothetical protein
VGPLRDGAPLQSDVSRRAGIVGGLDWRCPFREQADFHGIDHGLATLHLHIGKAGVLLDATVLHESGHHFGEAARRCAAAKRFVAELDRDGTPVAARLLVNVRFVR